MKMVRVAPPAARRKEAVARRRASRATQRSAGAIGAALPPSLVRCVDSPMRLKTLVLILGAIVVPLGVLQNLGAATTLSSSVHWLTTPVAGGLLSSGSTSAYAAYGGGDVAFPSDSPPPPPPDASTGTIAASATLAISANAKDATSTLPANAAAAVASAPAEAPAWMRPEASALAFNAPARAEFAGVSPRGATLHFTFGTSSMMDFVKNWIFFVRKAALSPFLIGAADKRLLDACSSMGVPAAAIIPELDVWTYQRKPKRAEVYEMKSNWAYMRHHKSDFLEMGLVKVAFLWELLSIGFSVLISDLDVVWLNSHWQRWMTFADPSRPPVPQAYALAAADVLVTTDELDTARDTTGLAHAMELNTGVVYLRATRGALAMVQSWRKAMLRQKDRSDLTENVNDQSLFNQVVRGGDVRDLAGWMREQRAQNVTIPESALAGLPANYRRVRQTSASHEPCLPGAGCGPIPFTYGTLPARPFTGGHTWFNQNVQEMAGHEQPQHEPITVHSTFQFGDTKEYPHGKRQRAREAALWAVDPPEYFTEGVFVALKGPSYERSYMDQVYKRFPEWSPQRHMFTDAPQRQAVRDLLGLATAIDGITVLPKLWCHCDRYWNALSRCRNPQLQGMALPFNCPMDSLYDTSRWNAKKVRFREHTFLSNPHMPAEVRANTITVTVAQKGIPVKPPTQGSVELPYGTPMASVAALVRKTHPKFRVLELANADLRRLCRWLGSSAAARDFNVVMRYITTESSRYCPSEDGGGYFRPGFDWQNPFHGINVSGERTAWRAHRCNAATLQTPPPTTLAPPQPSSSPHPPPTRPPDCTITASPCSVRGGSTRPRRSRSLTTRAPRARVSRSWSGRTRPRAHAKCSAITIRCRMGATRNPSRGATLRATTGCIHAFCRRQSAC